MEKALARSLSVSTSAVKIMNENPDRRYSIIINGHATETLYISFGDPAVTVNNGIPINCNGGNYEITALNLWKGEVYAIATGAMTVRTVEW